VFTFLEFRQMEYDNYIIYSYCCELKIPGGGGGGMQKEIRHNSIPSYRPDKASGMVAFLFVDQALGTGGSHFVSIDCPPKFAAALMLS
jgi:hypothetical protein